MVTNILKLPSPDYNNAAVVNFRYLMSNGSNCTTDIVTNLPFSQEGNCSTITLLKRKAFLT